MLLKKVLILVILVLNLIISINCDNPKYPTVTLQTTPIAEVEVPVLDDSKLLMDYIRLEEIRQRILQLFYDDSLIFIGQSLAWLGQTMILRDQLIPTHTSRIIRFVPFSGNFFKITTTNKSRLILNQHIMKDENLPTSEELDRYKNFLRGFGLDPRSIVDRFSSTGKRTVLIKKIKDCINLMSFMSIIFDWAKLEGISPNRLHRALKVFVVTIDLTELEIPSLITDTVFAVDVFSMNVDSISSTVERIAYPERRNSGYVRIVTNYPPQIWNEPPPALDREDEDRRGIIIHRLTEVIQDVAQSFINTHSPTLVLRSFDGVCPPRRSRFRRDLSRHDLRIKQMYLVLTYNRDVIETLEMEHAESSSKTSLDEFFEDQLKNSSSTVSRILNLSCNEFFSTHDECTKQQRFLHCDRNYESPEFAKKVTDSAVKIFSGRFKNRKNSNKITEDWIYHVVNSHSKLPVYHVTKTIDEAAKHCPDEKMVSILDCPSEHIEYLGQMVLAWFIEPYLKNFKPYNKEFVHFNQ